MVQLLSDAKAQQNSIGADNKTLTDAQIRENTLNLLTVSGGYISTERDDLGNILLHEDPNNIGSNKQRVNQYISIDVARRDYDDGELQKVFDTDITELFKSSKTKTVDELRAEIERMRLLLAAAEAEIIVQNVVADDGSGDGGGDGNGDTEPDEIVEIVSGDRMAPFTLEVEGKIFNIQTAIWDTDNQRINPNQIDVANQMIKYRVHRNNVLGRTYATFTSLITNPQYFQGWYFDAENLGNTQNYISLGTTGFAEFVLDSTRDANQGDPNFYTVAVTYKDEAPPVVTTDRLTFQMEEFDPDVGGFTGNRDDIQATFVWKLYDSEGNLIESSADRNRSINGAEPNPFGINVIEGQVLSMTMIRASQILGVNGIEGWYSVGHDDVKNKILTGVSGRSDNVLEYIIPADIKGLILAYIDNRD